MKKARFVVKGFQEKSHIQSDSPTGSKECLRILLSIIITKGWKVNSLDIKSAFLQGNLIQRNVFLVPPPEANAGNDILWKLHKCVYGLNDAARMWYWAIWEELTKLSCVRSSLDFGLFKWYNNGRLEGVFQSHVDDFLWAGSDAFENKVIVKLSQKF